MHFQPWSAKAGLEYENEKREKDMQPKVQIAELQKQTSILNDGKELSRINAELVYQLVEFTKQNQISADLQYKASQKLSKVAIFISIVALVVNVIQLFR